MKRIAGVVLLGVIALGLLAGCGGTQASPQGGSGAREIRIAHQNDAVTLIAEAQGWFEEEFGKDGTRYTLTRFVAGPPIMEAFSAGRQDVGYAGDMPPVAARASGIDVRAVGISGRNPTGNSTVVLAESPIRSVQDLKGRTLAAQVGSSQYHYALLLLEQKGLTGQVDVVNIQLTELRTALEAGTVDAIVANQTLAAVLEYEGVGRVLEDSLGVKPGIGLHLVRGEFADQNPDLVERWLKVIARTTAFIQENPEEAAEIAARETGYAAPVLEKVFRTTDYDQSFRPEDIEHLEGVRDFLIESRVIKKEFDVNDLVDSRFQTETAPAR